MPTISGAESAYNTAVEAGTDSAADSTSSTPAYTSLHEMDTLAPLSNFERKHLLPLLRARVPGSPILFLADIETDRVQPPKTGDKLKPGGLLHTLNTFLSTPYTDLATEVRYPSAKLTEIPHGVKLLPDQILNNYHVTNFAIERDRTYLNENQSRDEQKKDESRKKFSQQETIKSNKFETRFWNEIKRYKNADSGAGYRQVQSIFLQGDRVYDVTAFMQVGGHTYDYFDHMPELVQLTDPLLYTRHVQARSWQINTQQYKAEENRPKLADVRDPDLKDFLNIARTPVLPQGEQPFFEGNDHALYCHLFAMKLGMRKDQSMRMPERRYHNSDRETLIAKPSPSFKTLHEQWCDIYLTPVACKQPKQIHQTLFVGTQALTHGDESHQWSQLLNNLQWLYKIGHNSSEVQVQAFRDNAHAHYVGWHRAIVQAKNPTEAVKKYILTLCDQIEHYDQRLVAHYADMKEIQFESNDMSHDKLAMNHQKTKFLGDMAMDLRIVLQDFAEFMDQYKDHVVPLQEKRMHKPEVLAKRAANNLARFANLAKADVKILPSWLNKQLTGTGSTADKAGQSTPLTLPARKTLQIEAPRDGVSSTPATSQASMRSGLSRMPRGHLRSKSDTSNVMATPRTRSPLSDRSFSVVGSSILPTTPPVKSTHSARSTAHSSYYFSESVAASADESANNPPSSKTTPQKTAPENTVQSKEKKKFPDETFPRLDSFELPSTAPAPDLFTTAPEQKQITSLAEMIIQNRNWTPGSSIASERGSSSHSNTSNASSSIFNPAAKSNPLAANRSLQRPGGSKSPIQKPAPQPFNPKVKRMMDEARKRGIIPLNTNMPLSAARPAEAQPQTQTKIQPIEQFLEEKFSSWGRPSIDESDTFLNKFGIAQAPPVEGKETLNKPTWEQRTRQRMGYFKIRVKGTIENSKLRDLFNRASAKFKKRD